jgi:hypothetical protein
MASLRGNAWWDWPAHMQTGNAIERSKVDTSDPYAPGPHWTNQVNTAVWGTGGLDPAVIKQEALNDKLTDTYKVDVEGAGGVFKPGQTEGQYKSQLKKLDEARKAELARQQLEEKITLVAKQNEPQILASNNNAKATRENTAAQKEIAMAELLSGDKNAAAERLSRLQMAQDADLRAQQQWARQMEYEDKKTEAAKEEKALEALVAGLAALGAGFV